MADPRKTEVPISGMLSKKYAEERRKLIDASRATVDTDKGSPANFCDTVYFTVRTRERKGG